MRIRSTSSTTRTSSALSPRLKLALQFADAFLSVGGPPAPDVRAALEAEFTRDELIEMGVGLALFHGFSKLLIALGCEPDQMDVSIHRTPGA